MVLGIHTLDIKAKKKLPKLYKHNFHFTVKAILSMIKDKGIYILDLSRIIKSMHLRTIKFTCDGTSNLLFLIF